MRVRSRTTKLALCALIGAAVMLGQGSEAATAKKPKRAEVQKPAAVKLQQPRVRQNFRARRPEEIPPWEGFEDCPLMFPCVGPVLPHIR